MNNARKAEKLLKDIIVDINNYFAKVKNLDPISLEDIQNDPIIRSDRLTKDGYNKKDAVCKYCGTSGFEWSKTKWGWRMFDEAGEQHMCKNNGNNSDSTG